MIYVFPYLVACSLLFFADLFNSELRPVEWPVQEARALLDSSSWIQESATTGPRTWHCQKRTKLRRRNREEASKRTMSLEGQESRTRKDQDQGQERTRQRQDQERNSAKIVHLKKIHYHEHFISYVKSLILFKRLFLYSLQ